MVECLHSIFIIFFCSFLVSLQALEFTDQILPSAKYIRSMSLNNQGIVAVSEETGFEGRVIKNYLWKNGIIHRINLKKLNLPSSTHIIKINNNNLILMESEFFERKIYNYFTLVEYLPHTGEVKKIATLKDPNPKGNYLIGCYGFNDLGQVLGYDRRERDFIWEQKKGFTYFNNSFTPRFINNNNQVLGTEVDQENSSRRMVILDLITGHKQFDMVSYNKDSVWDYILNDFNDQKQIVGCSNEKAFLWDPTFGMIESEDFGISHLNNHGQVVGTYYGCSHLPYGLRAVLWDQYNIIDLSSFLSIPYGLNDHGQILGITTKKNMLHPILLTPKKENQ